MILIMPLGRVRNRVSLAKCLTEFVLVRRRSIVTVVFQKVVDVVELGCIMRTFAAAAAGRIG